MPFDPTLPTNNSPIVSAELRNQLNGLKELIDDVPFSGDVQQVINDSITAQTAGACYSVNYLNLTVSNPPTQAQMQALANKVDELLHALKRE